MTKTELLSTYTVEQLAEIVVELQNRKENKTMNISDIQKCQEEYEKVLKESPLNGTIDKICKDIVEQKNNAMAMEFAKIICDLLKRYGVYVHCTETKFSEKITTNSVEEKYGIVFDGMDFSQHDKEFTDKIKELEEELGKSNREHARMLWEFCDSVKKEDYDNEVNRLQSEVEKYRKAFEEAKKERDCRIAEYQNRTEKDKTELERARSIIDQIDDILEKLFGVRHDTAEKPDEFEKILADRAKGNVTDFFPTEPIKVADMLINSEGEYEHNPLVKKICGTDKGTYRIFDVSELRQIAEHLLVYCNHHGEMEE